MFYQLSAPDPSPAKRSLCGFTFKPQTIWDGHTAPQTFIYNNWEKSSINRPEQSQQPWQRSQGSRRGRKMCSHTHKGARHQSFAAVQDHV